MLLVFEPELFKPPISVSVFGSETRITRPIASKICTKNELHVHHVSSKIQVFTFRPFKVIAFFTSVAEFVFFSEKKPRDLRRFASRKSQLSTLPILPFSSPYAWMQYLPYFYSRCHQSTSFCCYWPSTKELKKLKPPLFKLLLWPESELNTFYILFHHQRSTVSQLWAWVTQSQTKRWRSGSKL